MKEQLLLQELNLEMEKKTDKKSKNKINKNKKDEKDQEEQKYFCF
jgi:hypothetical protein